MDNFATRSNAKTIPITALSRSAFKRWLADQPKATQTWLKTTEFEPDAGNVALLPGRDGALAHVVLGLGNTSDTDVGARTWAYAALPGKLPKARYQLDNDQNPAEAEAAAIGWALATYHFGRYRSEAKHFPTLVWPRGVDRAAVERARDATFLVRDLINTPAADLGPAELAEQATTLATQHGASVEVIVGEDLLAQNYPAIYAVGKGCHHREPRLVDIRWGDEDAPKLSLVGKGVVFDTGGLDIKTSGGMKLMKKDMGGAAHVLGLAHMIMDANLPVRLRVLLPIVENSVSNTSYHPLDVLDTRKGITIEVGNTDAEGRLILSDALFEADSEQPDLLIDFATLTGAARVALGTDLPALFSTDDQVAQAIIAAGEAIDDPLWRMPLFRGYRRQLDSRVADICNISSSPHGGAITAALFLQEFVGKQTRWVHIDVMAWNMSSRSGRPTGGDAMGMRAMFRMLQERYGG